MIQTINVDMDGVLCSEEKTGSKMFAEPYTEEIKKINHMYDDGFIIIINTARGWLDFKMTKEWLDKHGVKYHSLVCGKINADYVVDDRSFKSISELYNKVM